MSSSIMSPFQNSYTLDADHILKAAGVIGASAAVATVVDLGSSYYSGTLVVDVTAIEVASTDENYAIVAQGTNIAGFGTKTDVWDLGAILLGGGATGHYTDSTAVDVIGRYTVGFTNRHGASLLRYVRLYTVVAGAIASGINYSAFLAKNPVGV